MSAPKLSRILDAFAARLAAINGTGVFDTCIGRHVRRSQRPPAEQDVPCVLVFLGQRAPEKSNGRGQMVCSGTVVVEGYVRRGADEEAQGIQIISDIQQAVEIDRELGGLLLTSQGALQWSGDEVLYPENSDSVVGGRVEYSIPHLRESGDPEKA